MARNGKSIKLTRPEIKRLRKTLNMQGNVTEFLSEKGIHLQSLRYPLETGKISEKLYSRISLAGLI